ncbi:MAG: hypothetical protein ACUVV6_08295 [Thermoplasmatota archaeon]
MNIPKGRLVETLNGGPSVLRKLLSRISGEEFSGYIKVTSRREGMETQGVIILISSRPEMSIFIGRERVLGQESLRDILRESLDPSCTIRVFTLPEKAREEMKRAAERFASARVDPGAFDIAAQEEALTAAGAGVGASAGGEGARTPHPSEETEALYTTMAEMGVDTSELKRIEGELSRRETELKGEVDTKLREREAIKREEERFLKMDEAVSRVLREAESQRSEKEKFLANKVAELQSELSRRSHELSSRYAELQREVERLTREKEEMKAREEKLLEMEKMFRRVLTNTEERLKRKEEELLRKEEELERVVRQRMREIEELRTTVTNFAGTPRPSGRGEIEGSEVRARTTSGGPRLGEPSSPSETPPLLGGGGITPGSSGPAPGGPGPHDEDLRAREHRLQMREAELEERMRRFRQELEELERKREALERAHKGPRELELARLLKALDELFDHLPDEVVRRFAASAEFELYEAWMTRLGLTKK